MRRDSSALYAECKPVARSIGPMSRLHQIKSPEDRLLINDKAV